MTYRCIVKNVKTAFWLGVVCGITIGAFLTGIGLEWEWWSAQ